MLTVSSHVPSRTAPRFGCPPVESGTLPHALSPLPKHNHGLDGYNAIAGLAVSSSPQSNMASLRLSRLASRLAGSARRPPLRPQFRTKATVPFRLPAARNEVNPTYERNSPERTRLEAALKRLTSQLPLRSDIFFQGTSQPVSKSWDQPLPQDHATTFTNYPLITKIQVATAIDAALQTKKLWEQTPFVDRAAIFLKAAELVATKYRYDLIAATMLGQGKNIWQGEVDAAAELADFFRLNCNYAAELLERQPTRGSDGMWSRLDYRPLEGFVYAISPFNFTAIGGNLISGPAIMGNVVLWKPSPSNIYASTLVYKILLEAGLPPNVVQFVPGDPDIINDVVFNHRDFAGLGFVGSSDVFRSLSARVGQGIGNHTYREFPRLVGETSGKNFTLVHQTADVESAAKHVLRASFEYQGQKCSATSRLYLPRSRSEEFLSIFLKDVNQITIGSPHKDLSAFMGPVIHSRSFDKIKTVIDESNKDPTLRLLAGGTYDDSEGYYVKPTVYLAESPDHRLFNYEVFGPVLAVHVYPDDEWESTLTRIDQTGGGFALTGSVFAGSRSAIREAEDALRYAAGNFYISESLCYFCLVLLLTHVDCKTTAALIGQQSFGGSRASGTNDKAGSSNMLLRFTSPRLIKEEFFPQAEYLYPSNL
jgi:1-pyrroline-5-carboxylate dehydrogenase